MNIQDTLGRIRDFYIKNGYSRGIHYIQFKFVCSEKHLFNQLKSSLASTPYQQLVR